MYPISQDIAVSDEGTVLRIIGSTLYNQGILRKRG